MGRPKEAQVWHGPSPLSTGSGGRGGKEIQPSYVWVHSYQALLLSLDEAAKKLALLINTKQHWPYAFMQLCEDSQHIPLSHTRHLSIMVDSAPSRNACRHLSHLEVCKVLQFGSEVVYPEGLNGGLEPLQVPLPKQSIWDADSTSKLAVLQVNLSRTTPGDKPIVAPQWSSMLISTPHSITAYPSDIARGPSMTEEIEGILSSTMLDTSGQPSVHIFPRRPAPMASNTPVVNKGEVPSNSGEIVPVYPKQLPPSPHRSSQAGMADITAHSSHSPSSIPGTPDRSSSPTPLQLQTNSITLPDNVLHLQEEMNDAIVHLLTLKASVDVHQWKLISEMEIAYCQNESKTSEAIKEIKAHYVAALSDAQATHPAAVRDAEATHSSSAREAEVIHATAVRKAEAASVMQTSKLQQDHQETIQTLEDEVIEEGRCAHLSILQACAVALQACPNQALGVLMYPIHLLTGNMSLTSLLMAAMQLTIRLEDPIPSPSHPRRPSTTTQSTRAKQ